MRSPYNLAPVDHCNQCLQRQTAGRFCNMDAPPVEALNALRFTTTYPKGALLFVEGEPPRGVFLLCHGRAKLVTSSAEGRSLIIKMAEPGELLGASAVMLGKPYEVSVETLEASQVSFIRAEDFMRFLGAYPEASLHTARQLSEKYLVAQREIRMFGLAQTTAEKLAKLILEWSANGELTPEGRRARILFTHEEIGQMIGANRETVTRLLSEFRRKKLIRVKGASLYVLAADRMEAMVST